MKINLKFIAITQCVLMFNGLIINCILSFKRRAEIKEIAKSKCNLSLSKRGVFNNNVENSKSTDTNELNTIIKIFDINTPWTEKDALIREYKVFNYYFLEPEIYKDIEC